MYSSNFRPHAAFTPPPDDYARYHYSSTPGSTTFGSRFSQTTTVPEQLVSGSFRPSTQPPPPPSSTDEDDHHVLRARSPSLYHEPRSKHCHDFPWKDQIDYHGDALVCGNQIMRPSLHVRLEKGFALERVKDASPPDIYWTSYRRNYFSICVSTMFDADDVRLPIAYRGRPVKAFGYRLTAATFSRNTEKDAELVQYGPKREKEGLGKPQIKRIPLPVAKDESTPSPDSSFRPVNAGTGRSVLGSDVPADALSYDNSFHTYERIQFKKATANNGKRRAQQQFYHLRVELLADMSAAGSSTPIWEPLALRVSEGIIVRGRSPSHYKAEADEQDDLVDAPSPRIKHESPAPTYLPRISPAPSKQHRPLPPLDAPGSSIVSPASYHYSRPLHHEHYTHTAAPSISREEPLDRNTLDTWRKNPTTSEGYSYFPGPIYRRNREGETYATASSNMETALQQEYRGAAPGLAWDPSYPDDYEASGSHGLYPRNLPSGFSSSST